MLKVLALAMLLATMLSAGLQINREHLGQVFKDYGLLGRAFLANFILVPLVAVLLVRLFHIGDGVAIGIMLMSMAPGVPFLVNSAGREEGGSHAFALTISVCFAALSVLTIPLTIVLLIRIFPALPTITVPGATFLTTLAVSQLAPLLIGAWLGPRLTQPTIEKSAKALHAIVILAALALIILIFPRIVDSVSKVAGQVRILTIVLIAVFSIGIGWLLGGPQRSFRRTLSIATLMLAGDNYLGRSCCLR